MKKPEHGLSAEMLKQERRNVLREPSLIDDWYFQPYGKKKFRRSSFGART